MPTIPCLIAAVLSTGLAAGAEQEALLVGFETLERLSPGYDAKNPASKMSLNTDRPFVSEGKASLLLESVSAPDTTGSTYVSVSVALPKPISLQGHMLVFDAWTTQPANTQALYIRGFDAAGKCAASWQTWSSPAREAGMVRVELIPGMSSGGLTWEPDVAVSPNREGIARLEFIIGTRGHGVPYSMYLDNVRLVPSEVKPFMEIDKVKPLYPQTPLLEAGKPNAAIVCPADDAWQQVARDLQSALAKKLGAALPIKSADQLTDDDLRATHVIALGCVTNNARLLHLYAHLYTYADDLYPGPEGYWVQSIHDPWGTGKNVLLIGASTVEGARAGTPELLAAVPADGTVPPVFKVKLSGLAAERWQSTFDREPNAAYQQEQHAAAETALERGAHTGLFSQIGGVGEAYALTRKDGYADLFAWLVRRAKAHHDTNPGTYGGPWGMDSDFSIHRVLPRWDQVEESPALSDEDRLEVTRILFQWVSDVGEPKARGVVGNERVRFNHQTFPALGLLFAGEYFTKYYHAAEARSWTSIADAAFQMQAKAFKPYEDCNGYQWLTLYHTMLYALAKPDLTFFENGNARRCADFAILCMDNLGYQVTYGDTGAFTGWWSEMPFLRGALWRYGDRRYAWAWQKKFAVSNRISMGEYSTDSGDSQRGDSPRKPQEPTDLIGAIAWPLDPYYYRTFAGPDKLPEERAIDKVVFRDGFDPQDQYLLLDGLSNGGHKHLDGNSISRWTENGRIWLADADYILSLPKYHNGVLIFHDGQSQQIPDFVELEHMVDLPSFGASTTTYRHYAGVDWRRHILWLKGQCFVVADELVALEDGDYSFRLVWNAVGEVELTDAGMSIHQDGQYATVAITSDCRLTLDDDAAYGRNWSGYPYIREPVVRVLRAIRDCRLKAGERVVLFSLLHASGEAPSKAQLVRLNENWAAVTGLDEPLHVGVGGARWPMDAAGEGAGFSAKADAIVLSPTKAYLVGASEVAYPQQTRTFKQGADLEYDLRSGQAQVHEPAVTVARFRGPAGQLPGGAIAPERIRVRLDAALASAPRVNRPTTTGVRVPRELKTLWSYGEKLNAYLLTNNAGAFEAVDAGLKLSCTPAPLAANVFGPEQGGNTIENVVDGDLLSTGGAVMWDDDQPVTINLDFDNDYDIGRLVVKAWFATSSSKNKLYQLGRIAAEASSDGFQRDVRRIVDSPDTEEHGNWGAPGHAPHVYEFADLNQKARALRLTLTPRPGTGVYVAEIEAWGNRAGLAADYAKRKGQGLPAHSYAAVELADLDGNGVDELIAGSANGKVYAFDAAGKRLWETETGPAVNDVAAVDFAGNDRPAVVVAGMEGIVTALSPTGQKLWTFQVPYYKRTGHVRVVFPADLSGDGRQTAIVGADNWHFYAINGEGKQVWHYESVHGSTCGAAADVDGDGKQEVIAGTEYYWWHVVRPDGTRLFQYSTRGGPHANAAAAANLDGAATRCVVFGGADGNLHALGPDGALRWLFNTGDEVTSVAAADVNGDGRDEVLASSMSFNVYCIDASGKLLWRRDLGTEVTSLLADGAQRVIAASRDGGVYVLDASDGAVLSGLSATAAPLSLAIGRGAAGARLMALSASDGDVRVLELQ